MRREQLGAWPRTLTTDFLEFLTSSEPASFGSGGETSLTRVGERPSNTSGKPRVSTVSRRAWERASAWAGIALSTTLRMIELLTERASQGNDDVLRGAATSQTTRSTATTETTAPPALSTAWALRLTI